MISSQNLSTCLDLPGNQMLSKHVLMPVRMSIDDMIVNRWYTCKTLKFEISVYGQGIFSYWLHIGKNRLRDSFA